ncbi:MAG: PD-(D/E)XK nuclease family protein [Cystobacterineae bacterium]|nr:PD-(D/E)XK nuclease family protein [Cystobacterineae bacterium]
MNKPCLHIFTTVEQLEQSLKQEARKHGAACAQSHMLLSHFIEQCIPFEEKRLCTPQEQVLIAWETVRRHFRDNREHEADFRIAQLFIEQLKSIRLQGCLLEDWRQVSFKLRGQALLLWFADVWETYAALLSARLLMDEVDVLYAAIDELNKQKLPKQFWCNSKVFIHNLVQTTPLEQRFFFALDKALSSVGVELFLETCGVDNPELDGLVDELHAGFERDAESSNLNLTRDVLDAASPAFELCKHVFRETLPEASELPWDCFVAPNACREVRETTRRIAHLLKLGVAPESIAVVLCTDGVLAHAVWHELSSHSIPAHIQEEVLLSSCALGNAILGWLKWIEEGFPVEQVHLFFSNPLFEKTFVHHDDVGIWLLRAGIGRHSKQESLDEYVVRLSLLQESEPSSRGFIETLKRRVEVAKKAVEHILEAGTFEDMLDSWHSSLQKLGLNLNASTKPFQAEKNVLSLHSQFALSLFETQVHRRRLAQENSTKAFFRHALLDWKLRLKKTGTHAQKLTRKEFSEWLLTSFGNEAVRIQEPKTAGVTVAHHKTMRGQKYRHVFFLGMKDKAFSPPPKHALIPEALQSLVNANSERIFFRMQRGESLHKLPEDIVLERRSFAQAVVCATQKLCFSYSLAEPGGRDVVPSLFWKEALRISKKTVPTFSQRSCFSQQWGECMTDSDFRGHVAQKIRRSFYEFGQAAPMVETSLGQECWFAELLEKSEAQRERFYFQRDRTRAAGAYTGKVFSPKTEKYLEALTQLPWSAYAFGRLGGCAFWFFMEHVLKGEVFEDFRMDAGPKTKGVLLHRSLAMLGEEGGVVSLWKERKSLSEAQLREKLGEVVRAAQKAVEPSHGLLHPELWALCCEQAEEELFELFNSPSLFPLGAPSQTFVEWRFEETAQLESGCTLAEPDSKKHALQLAGRLDRLDVLDDDSLGVVDYKLSKRGSKNEYREGLLRDDFQLLLYLFILRKRGKAAKRAAWVFIREKAHFLLEELITQEALDEILEQDLATRLALKEKGRPNLLNRIEELLSKVRGGDFAPLPVDCGYCPLKRACRVVKRATLRVEEGG